MSLYTLLQSRSLERKARISRGMPILPHASPAPGTSFGGVQATKINQSAGSKRTRRASSRGHACPAPPRREEERPGAAPRRTAPPPAGPAPPRRPAPRVTGPGRAVLSRCAPPGPEMPLFSVPKEVAVGTAMLGVAFATGMLAGKRRPRPRGLGTAPSSPCPPPRGRAGDGGAQAGLPRGAGGTPGWWRGRAAVGGASPWPLP